MDDSRKAEETLRVIRALMERAVIYRTISGPGALFGGALSCGVAAVLASGWKAPAGQGHSPGVFVATWLTVLILAAAFNTWLLWKHGEGSGPPFISRPMRAALWAILPPLAAGGVAGLGAALSRGTLPCPLQICAAVWVLSYGLALHAAAPFSPASLKRLGWVFYAAGLGLSGGLLATGGSLPMQDSAAASLIMGISFGLFHLVYGTAVVFRSARADD